ncbi:glycosyltransferase [Neorhizobium sp. P12A]|uniref:WecB/TagA/CpsF family glycosyltransferase n=1 Tax=Rhizobium/Agrobacterium group TaxID=227290 RepID=UPI001053E009|nr:MULTISPECIES: WecB/TagA/CpsF family glycosyltransferase [Rhizobium/Agrobacterium group]KAA0699537.1 glycosyltransferase [Neorhizobium sp. P12A]TCR91140.1 exopolysaccharide biosynthesis WecB/TagA/CpsF family protein [Rhizobium sp. BK376]
MNLIANFAVLASRRMIFDLPVCDLGWDDALTFINELASLPLGQTVISFVNAHNMLVMLRDEHYRDVLVHNLVLPDGIGVDIASRVAHGASFPANLNGTDFVPALLTFMEQPKRIGLVGGRRDIVEKAAENFRNHAPWHEFVVISDGYFDKVDSSAVTSEIERQKLDVLIVGMGTPLQEKWVADHIRPQHARLVMTVGALFDFVSGTVPRAPRMVRALRLEWIFRLLQEPSRLWRRYIVGVPVFLFQVVWHRFGPRYSTLRQTVGSVRADAQRRLPAPEKFGR